MKNGGWRPGSGRPKGAKSEKTLSKELAREALRVMVTKHMAPMVRRQIAHALGIGHLYTRDTTGKFTKITSQAEVDRLLSDGREGKHYWIFTKDPSTQAFTELMNRALDKPAEQMQEIKMTGDLTIVTERLEAARKRLAASSER